MLIGYMSQKQNWRITYQDSAYVIFQKAQEWFSICFYDLTKRYVILIFERVSVTNFFKKKGSADRLWRQRCPFLMSTIQFLKSIRPHYS